MHIFGLVSGRRFLLACALFLVVLDSHAQRAQVVSKGKGAVSSVNEIATDAGISVLERGGNALDAAVAVAYTLGVVDSHNSGVGGGCFILMRLASGEILAIDGREMAPAKAHRDMYLVNGKIDKTLSKTGAMAVGIPGSVKALEKMHGYGGKLDLASLIQPAAEIAEKGFVIDGVLARRLNSTREKLSRFPESSKIFVKKAGKPWKKGDTLVQKDLAKTYRNIAVKGSDYFYKGGFAKSVDAWMKQNGGLVTASDFHKYFTLVRKPVKTDFGDYSLYGFPPPSSGGIAVAQILKMVQFSGYSLKQMDVVDRYHLIIESMRRAFADRAYWLGDADYVSVPKNLVANDYIKSRIKGVSLDKVNTGVDHGIPKGASTRLFDKHTTHFNVVDGEGNWVAITTTLNTSFGSKVTVPGTGVLLNNQMDDFSIQPGVPNAFGLVGAEANAVAAGKRPLSSMSPTLVVKKGEPVLAIGAAGGPTIISQVAQGILNYVMLDLPLDKAIAEARVHHQWKPDMVLIDGSATDKLKNGLKKRGFRLKDWPAFGATQAIAKDGNQFYPVSEPRLEERNH